MKDVSSPNMKSTIISTTNMLMMVACRGEAWGGGGKG
jgi:hypothetical protein